MMETEDSLATDSVPNVNYRNLNTLTKDEELEQNLIGVDEPVEDRSDMVCGIGSFRPACLQTFTNMYSFVFFYSFAGLTTSTLVAYITSQLTALERQFGFSSTESGFLLACNDIGFLMTVLFISHYLRNSHAPRWLSFLTGLFGISGLICALPYFLGSANQDNRKVMETMNNNNYLRTNSTTYYHDHEYMCQQLMNLNNPIKSSGDENNSGDGNRNRPWTDTLALITLAIGMIIQGVAKSGRSPLVTTYLDNNVQKTETGKYIGILAAVAMLAPSIAFSSATIFSRLYFTLEETDLTPEDPRWIGAWWLGFLVFGCAALIFMIPVMLFPRKMPQKNRENETRPKTKLQLTWRGNHKNDKFFSSLKSSLKGFLKSILRLLRRPAYVLLTIALSVEITGVAGIFSFGSKYVEVQFFLPAWKSNAFLGMIKIVALSGGAIMGGILTTKLKLSARGSLAMISGTFFLLGTINSVYLLAGCELPPIVGPDSVPFRNPAPAEYMMPQCISSCFCDEHRFLPVCFNNTITYFSPCFAGCNDKNGTTYTNCKCLPVGSTVNIGICETGCNSLYYYMAAALTTAFIGPMLFVPSYIANLRIVGDEDKSLAIGMLTFFMSLLGWMLGPVVFGLLIDAACLVWNNSSAGRGSCSLYDNTDLKNYMFISQVVLTFVASAITFLALIAQIRGEKRRKKTEQQHAEIEAVADTHL